ncbi:MAG: hypothetical protein PXZ07_05370 [Candidatus Eremiobacteraeota bacterium]|nr:hypothetical protein [Candidatus Eremiobacteraeota bacterium]
MSPDALWRIGNALWVLGIDWMSGALALALEPRYHAHLLGVVGEALLDPKHLMHLFNIEDLVNERHNMLTVLQESSMNRAVLSLDTELHSIFQAAWLRWYAFTREELSFKERETRFERVAPPIARVVTLLRKRQRADGPPILNACSYHLAVRSLDKEIKSLFSRDGGTYQRDVRDNSKRTPRFNVLEYGRKSCYLKKMLKIIAPGGKRPSPAAAYKRGWEAYDEGLPGASGLLALALFDYEVEYYTLLARLLEEFHRSQHRGSGRTPSDNATLLNYKRWWKALWSISCMVGPFARSLEELNEPLFELVPKRLWVNTAQLHVALLSDDSVGNRIRQEMTIPEDIANQLQGVTASDYEYDTDKTPRPLAAVLDMLHGSIARYSPDDIRAEFFWWLRGSASELDRLT